MLEGQNGFMNTIFRNLSNNKIFLTVKAITVLSAVSISLENTSEVVL